MESKDILLVPHGSETPQLHTLSINDKIFNIAIELKTITLLGPSLNTVNSEYRKFNLNTKRTEHLFNNNSDNVELNKLYKRLHTLMKSKIKKATTLKSRSNTLKNITHRGLQYGMIYYLLLKRYQYKEEQFVTFNSFEIIPAILDIYEKVLEHLDPKLTPKEIKALTDYLIGFDQINASIGSKLMCLTRSQVMNTSDLTQSIWKTLYINKIIQNMQFGQRNNYLAHCVDWGLLRCATKDLLTNATLLARVTFGENIHFIRSTAQRQSDLARELIVSRNKSDDLDMIKELTNKLKQVTTDIDYAYEDISVVLFYRNMGTTLYEELNNIMNALNERKDIKQCSIYGILTDISEFKILMFQYLYGILLLAKYGIIHNDLHLNNLLVSKLQTKQAQKFEFTLPSRNVINIGASFLRTTLIDYDKAILSHRHHNNFEKTASDINQEVGVVFDVIKETIVDNNDQIFNCYVMYDVVRLGITLRRTLEDFDEELKKQYSIKLDRQYEFLDDMIKKATDILQKIYDPKAKFPFDIEESHGSIQWLVETLFRTNLKSMKSKSSSAETANQVAKVNSSFSDDRPEFISSKRKYADLLKHNLIAKYATMDK